MESEVHVWQVFLSVETGKIKEDNSLWGSCNSGFLYMIEHKQISNWQLGIVIRVINDI